MIKQITFPNPESEYSVVSIKYREGYPRIDQAKIESIRQHSHDNPKKPFTECVKDAVDFMSTICRGTLVEVVIYRNFPTTDLAQTIPAALLAAICDNIVQIPSKQYSPDELRAIYLDEAFPPPAF